MSSTPNVGKYIRKALKYFERHYQDPSKSPEEHQRATHQKQLQKQRRDAFAEGFKDGFLAPIKFISGLFR